MSAPATRVTRGALAQLFVMFWKNLWREPWGVTWTFAVPLMLAVVLAMAFHREGAAELKIAVVEEGDFRLAPRLDAYEGLNAVPMTLAEGQRALEMQQVALLLLVRPGVAPEMQVNASSTEHALAQARVRDALERNAGRQDLLTLRTREVGPPAVRYIDFLIPGLLGVTLLGSSIASMSYTISQARSARLLKQLAVTPAPRGQYLLSLLLGRMSLAVLEVFIFLGAARLLFGVPLRGNLFLILGVGLLGSLSFSGLGLLIASRLKGMDVVGGVANLLQIPMTLLCGVFFPATQFPDWAQPLVQSLPLTAFNDAMRAVMLSGLGASAIAVELLSLSLWALGSFALGLRVFRWH